MAVSAWRAGRNIPISLALSGFCCCAKADIHLELVHKTTLSWIRACGQIVADWQHDIDLFGIFIFFLT